MFCFFFFFFFFLLFKLAPTKKHWEGPERLMTRGPLTISFLPTHTTPQPPPPSQKPLALTTILTYSLLFILFFFFLGPHLQHIDVPRLGVESELQLPTYTTATATLDLSYKCHRHHSLWQCQILNSLSKARGRTRVLMDTSQIQFLLSHIGNPNLFL